jgi:competence protein ComEC
MPKKIIIFIALFLFFLNFFCWKEVFALSGSQNLKVDFLNVGQGDSFLIETPDMQYILIDGGPDSTVLQKLADYMPFWDKEIDLVILTHPDSDHVTGLIDVLQKYKVDDILWTGIKINTATYQKWLTVLAEQQKMGAKIIIAQSNEEIKAGNVLINILNPINSLAGKYFKDDNDTGVVSRLLYGKISFLFSADITSKEEQQLVDSKSDLQSNVLKVAHHGSKYSTSDIFLAAVEPQIAVISDGKNNSYGFPTADVLQRLQEFGIKIFRTDQDGDVEFVSDGNNIKLLKN